MAGAPPLQTWKTDSLEGLDRGSRVWWKSSPTAWLPATLQNVGSKECTIALDTDSGPGTGQVVKAQPDLLVPANPPILDGVNDLTSLSYLNEPSILHDLRQRYDQDQIYTHAGPVLIAVNPFKAVQKLYTREVLQHYTARTSREQHGYEPHIFLTADKAYKEMCRAGASQSIVINGESGAGKTETTKIAMRYLAGLAGGTGVEDQVLETNPLLEAFGNAKTLRNNNSSRFGKLIQIYFNNARHICGALIQTYLLEKSRVTHQLPGERNYHIFYQLCRGATAEECKKFSIPDNLEDFAYLSASGCSQIAGTDDAADFQHVKHSMAVVGIDEESQELMFSLLSATLWLGNIQFQRKTADSVDVVPSAALSTAARLLRVPEERLVFALSKRKITAGGEVIDMDLKLEAALDTRDALAKSIYAALFRWLVDKINKALAVGNKRTSGTSLSILDIYGFECFKENSFEQLCINFANERLQQQFNRHLFKLEQEVYASEGIDWTHVDFEDNQLCVDLIEARPPRGIGILSLLDEECIYPKATDATFSAKLRSNLMKNPHFGYDKRSTGGDFLIDHFAGDVVYSCHKFLDKNRDTLSPDLVQLMLGSEHPLLAGLAVDIATSQAKRGSQTVGNRFREQLQDLITRLDETELHFVRCIKPNGLQVAATFDAPLTLHQLRCCGVLEVTRIARAGYPTRYLHRNFAERYHVLLHGAGEDWEGRSPLEVCRELLQEFRIPPDMYQIGRTKLFFRAGVLGHLEDTSARINRAVMYMQSQYRMVRERRTFLKQRRSAMTIQSHARGKQARIRYADMLRRHKAAVVIQSRQRGRSARRRYRSDLAAVVRLQMGLRRWQLSNRMGVRLEARRKREAEAARIAAMKQAEAEQWEAVQKRFGKDAGQIIDVLEHWKELQSRFGKDAGQITDVLELWEEHGKDFMVWKESPPAPEPAPPPPVEQPPLPPPEQQQPPQSAVAALAAAVPAAAVGGAAAAGMLASRDISPAADIAEPRELPAQPEAQPPAMPEPLGSAAADDVGGLAVPESALEQIALWEEYSCKLEQRVHALTHENDALQRQIIGVQETLAAAAIDGTPARGQSATSTRSVLTPADGSTTSEQPEDFEDASASNQREAVASGERYVDKLNEELGKRAPMFVDDANFIREVKEGVSQTLYPMDPDSELRNLMRTWTEFKRDFEVRLDDTAKVLRKVDKDRGPRVARSPRASNGPRSSAAPTDFSSPPQRSGSGRPGTADTAESMEDGRKRAPRGSLMSKFSFSRKGGSSPSSPSPKHN